MQPNFVDLTGRQFGRLTVLKRVGYDYRGSTTRYICRCECGVEKEVTGKNLLRGDARSCGNHRTGKDETGNVFGNWTVIRHVPSMGGIAHVLCRCACGTERNVQLNRIRRGASKSCGCWRIKQPQESAKRSLYREYKCHAARKNRAFTLSLSQFSDLVTGLCDYCGVPPRQKKRARDGGYFLYNGIDRVDNSRGYETDNVVTCCETCNKAKRVMSRDDFLAWIIRIVKFYFPPPGNDPHRLADAYEECFGYALSHS